MTSPKRVAPKGRKISSVLYSVAAAVATLILPSFANAECSSQVGVGGCVMQFCMDWPDTSSTCRGAWYTVSGSRFNCTSCDNISSCATSAANRCAALAQGTTTPTTTTPPRTTTPTTTPTTSTTTGANSCRYANDGECDEGSYCSRGTDTTDCRSGSSTPSSTTSTSTGNNSCEYAFDDVCDEPSYCGYGTDTYDCTHEDSGGCSLSELGNANSGLGTVGGSLLLGMLLFPYKRKRRNVR